MLNYCISSVETMLKIYYKLLYIKSINFHFVCVVCVGFLRVYTLDIQYTELI